MNRGRHAACAAWAWLARTARLAVGQPDYEAYIDHLRRHHPGAQIPSRDAFFRERQQARYGGRRPRCC